MARIRTIKPEFFTSEDIVSLTPLARLFYVSLWCEADREGRFEWKPRTLKMRYLPADNCDVESLGQELIDGGLVMLYEANGRTYAVIPGFKRHQVINNREQDSDIPEPPSTSSDHQPPRVKDACLTRESGRKEGREGKGKEGKELEANASVDRDAVNTPSLPPCPYDQIVNAYAEALPQLQQVAVVSDARRRSMNARWREVCAAEKFTQAEGVQYFRDYFGHCATSPFLVGNGSPDRSGRVWKADFDWLLNPQNFVKVIEGKYHQQGRAA